MNRMKSRSIVAYATGSFEWAEAILANTGRLTPEQVALVLENNPDTPLTRTLRHYLVRLKRRERRSGVKPRNAAAWEFIFFDAKALYETKLADVRRERDAEASGATAPDQAAERAYRAVLEEIKTCHIDWVTLRNLLSLRSREPALFFDVESRLYLSSGELAA